MNRKEQQFLRQRQTTRQLMGVTRLTEHGAVCGRDELLFYLLRPDNLSILSPKGIRGRVRALTGMYKSNWGYLSSRINTIVLNPGVTIRIQRKPVKCYVLPTGMAISRFLLLLSKNSVYPLQALIQEVCMFLTWPDISKKTNWKKAEISSIPILN